MLSRIYAHFDEHVETYLATVALVIFTSLVVAQVIMRYIFNSPLVWSEEIARFALVWFVFLSGSYAVKYQKHVKFSVLVDIIGKRSPIVKRVIHLLVFVMWLAFLVFMCYLSFQSVVKQFHTGQVSAAAHLPIYLVYIGLPLGLLLMAFRVTQHTIRAVIDLYTERNAPIALDQQEFDVE